jgi:hypothetical protein
MTLNIKNLRGGILLCVLAFGYGACRTTSSPPIRNADFGAPGHLQEGRIEIAAAGGAQLLSDTFPKGDLAPSLALSATDWMTFELGGSWAPNTAAVGWGGLRATPLLPWKTAAQGLSLDIAIGGGGGVGGKVCDNEELEPEDSNINCPGRMEWDGLEWYERSLWGVYAEAGLGYHFRKWLALYWRPRWQLSKSENVPYTNWVTAFVVSQFTIREIFNIHIGVAPSFCHVIGISNNFGIAAELSLSLEWGLWKKNDAKKPMVSIDGASM